MLFISFKQYTNIYVFPVLSIFLAPSSTDNAQNSASVWLTHDGEEGLKGVPSAKLSESITVERVAPGPGNVVEVFVNRRPVHLV